MATPVDQYQLTDRATKYAILLIALTFMVFFVFEILTGQWLHPMQYLLVGLSLSCTKPSPRTGTTTGCVCGSDTLCNA
ncbi:hypothetical protein CBX57_005135 [Salmonella enterica]|nr:hypothetical protein [Salmonella enterica]